MRGKRIEEASTPWRLAKIEVFSLKHKILKGIGRIGLENVFPFLKVGCTVIRKMGYSLFPL